MIAGAEDIVTTNAGLVTSRGCIVVSSLGSSGGSSISAACPSARSANESVIRVYARVFTEFSFLQMSLVTLPAELALLCNLAALSLLTKLAVLVAVFAMDLV